MDKHDSAKVKAAFVKAVKALRRLAKVADATALTITVSGDEIVVDMQLAEVRDDG